MQLPATAYLGSTMLFASRGMFVKVCLTLLAFLRFSPGALEFQKKEEAS
ncbi:hypothetical protein [Lentibacillus salicampi]|nr:hypothetical protein [Lentibacillus salicampi]